MKSLHAPPQALLVRECTDKVVASLKEEILDNPCGDVPDQSFDRKIKEAYLYDTIGGNHSRQALQDLLKENPSLHNKRLYTHRLCAVYAPMEVKHARRLDLKAQQSCNFFPRHDYFSLGEPNQQCFLTVFILKQAFI